MMKNYHSSIERYKKSSAAVLTLNFATEISYVSATINNQKR